MRKSTEAAPKLAKHFGNLFLVENMDQYLGDMFKCLIIWMDLESSLSVSRF